MGHYLLGFTIDQEAVRLAVAQEKGVRWELLHFLKSQPLHVQDKWPFPERDELLAVLMQLYESVEFETYRHKLENGQDKFTVAVGIQGEFSWLRYIPFPSLEEMYNRKSYQKAVDECLRVDIPYPSEVLVYDIRQSPDPMRPCAYLLAAHRKVHDTIVGTGEQESVFEQAGFPKPATVIAESQALFTLYPLVAENKKDSVLLVHLRPWDLELSVIEDMKLRKTENMRLPNLASYSPQERKFFFCVYLLGNLKMAFTYGLQEGKSVRKVILFGSTPLISLEELQMFLREVLGKRPHEINTYNLSAMFPQVNIRALMDIGMERYKAAETHVPGLTEVLSHGAGTSGGEAAALAEETSPQEEGSPAEEIPPGKVQKTKPMLEPVSAHERMAVPPDPMLESEEGVSPQPMRTVMVSSKRTPVAQPERETSLSRHIYERLLAQEQTIGVESIDPKLVHRFTGKENQQRLASSAKQLVAVGVAVHALSAQEQNPNLARPFAEKKVSALERFSETYLPETAVNLLVFLMLCYAGLMFFQDYQASQTMKQLQREQWNLLQKLNDENSDPQDSVYWQGMPWDKVEAWNPATQSSQPFPSVQRQNPNWGKALQEIARVLPGDAVVTSLLFEVGGGRGRSAPQVRIEGHAPSATKVLEAFAQKATVIRDVRLGAPIQANPQQENFVLVGEYMR